MSKKIKGCFCRRNKANLNLPPPGNASSVRPGERHLIFVITGASKGVARDLTERSDVPPVGTRQENQPVHGGQTSPGTIDYCDHITLNTGEIRRLFPTEVSREERDSLLPYVKRAAAGLHTEVPICVDLPGDTAVGVLALRGSVSGPCLALTVYGTTYLAGMPLEAAKCQPIVTIAVSPGGSEGADLWGALSADRSGMVATERARPETPWCASKLFLEGSESFFNALPTIAGLVRCIAWVWYDAMMPEAGPHDSGSRTYQVGQPQAANDDAFDIGSTGD